MMFLPSLAGGGAERSMCTIANGLSGLGIEVSLVLAQASGPYLGSLAPSVRIVDLEAASTLHALPALALRIRRECPDAVLSAMSHANVVAALAHRLARSRARLVLSERVNLSAVLSECRGLRIRINRSLMAWTYPWADRIVAVSFGVAQDLARQLVLAPGRLVTIYNPVVDTQLMVQSEGQALHPWLVAGGVPVVLAAGRLIAQKDFGTLIAAFARLRQERSVRLIIIGEGEERAALLVLARQLGVAQDVDLPGFMANPMAAMRAAQVFVLSSRFEGLPGVLIQAMACGTPVVSTDCPSGPREILQDGHWGRLVPVGDVSRMAEAIKATLEHLNPPDVRFRAEAFSTDQAVRAYADVLGLVIEDRVASGGLSPL
jgi:glycosyltransferase involved in cell wall biosynthesis